MTYPFVDILFPQIKRDLPLLVMTVMKNHANSAKNGVKKHNFYTISQAAQLSHMSAKMIRYYESKSLLPPAKRTLANYRFYSWQDIQMLRLIKRSREFGFPLTQVKQLIKLWDNQHRASQDVKQLVMTHIEELEEKIKQMQIMRNTLMQLADCCRDDQEPQCFILDSLTEVTQSKSTK